MAVIGQEAGQAPKAPQGDDGLQYRFPLGPAGALSDHQQGGSSRRHEEMGLLDGAAEVEEIGPLEEQSSVEPFSGQQALECRDPPIQFCLGSDAHRILLIPPTYGREDAHPVPVLEGDMFAAWRRA